MVTKEMIAKALENPDITKQELLAIMYLMVDNYNMYVKYMDKTFDTVISALEKEDETE